MISPEGHKESGATAEAMPSPVDNPDGVWLTEPLPELELPVCVSCGAVSPATVASRP